MGLFCGTDQFLIHRVPGAADELLRKRVATLSVLEKLLDISASYTQQSILIPGMNILYFFSFKANIGITTIGVAIKVVLTPFLWLRKKRLKRLEACNAIKKISLKKYYEGKDPDSLVEWKVYSIKYESVRRIKLYQSLKA